MLRTVFPSIIRGSRLHIYLMLYVQSWTPDDERKCCPKHVEWYSINSKNCASSRFYYRKKKLNFRSYPFSIWYTIRIHTCQLSAALRPFQQDLEHHLSALPKGLQCEQFHSCAQGSHSSLKSGRERFTKLQILITQLKLNFLNAESKQKFTELNVSLHTILICLQEMYWCPCLTSAWPVAHCKMYMYWPVYPDGSVLSHSTLQLSYDSLLLHPAKSQNMIFR